MHTSLLAQLAALPEMEATEMEALWKRLYQKPPPSFNRSNYIKQLAYRIQELVFGVDCKSVEVIVFIGYNSGYYGNDSRDIGERHTAWARC